jgi:integral membrane protein
MPANAGSGGAQSVSLPGSTYTSRVPPRTYAQLFRIVATAEAVSWAGLLTGMYFKYLTDAGDVGVRIFGPIHGGIFLAYVLMTFLVSRAFAWGRWTTLVGLACSVPPFATLPFEMWAQRNDRLSTPTTSSPHDSLRSPAVASDRA